MFSLDAEIPGGRDALYRSMGGGHHDTNLFLFISMINEVVMRAVDSGWPPSDIIVIMSRSMGWPGGYIKTAHSKVEVVETDKFPHASVFGLLNKSTEEGMKTLADIAMGDDEWPS